jgi:hypothetical protein
MDMNEYCLQRMTLERIAEMRAQVEAANLRAVARTPRRPLRIVVGQLLVRAGNRLLEGFTPARAAA